MTDVDDFHAGDRVRHFSLGTGTVVSVDDSVTVDFDAPVAGKAEPAPTYDAQPPGLTVLAPKRPVE